MGERGAPTGHVFISYVREDSRHVDALQRILQAAGIRVWRDTADLWPGEDWRTKIRRAITSDALVFIACFSRRSTARRKSYQNEELNLAIEELRQRPEDQPWFVPVRLDDCQIPGIYIGGGNRTLSHIQCVDLFGKHAGEGAARLVAAILRILGPGPGDRPPGELPERSPEPANAAYQPKLSVPGDIASPSPSGDLTTLTHPASPDGRSATAAAPAPVTTAPCPDPSQPTVADAQEPTPPAEDSPAARTMSPPLTVGMRVPPTHRASVDTQAALGAEAAGRAREPARIKEQMASARPQAQPVPRTATPSPPEPGRRTTSVRAPAPGRTAPAPQRSPRGRRSGLRVGVPVAGLVLVLAAAVVIAFNFARTPPGNVTGGTVTFGLTAGNTPAYIFPVTPAATSSAYTAGFFQNLMWKPLWWTPAGRSLNVDYPLSLASKPVFSDDNKIATINMKTTCKWANGQPVDAQDVIFFIDLAKAAVALSAANYGNYSPGGFPANVVSAVATGKYTLQINFTKSYNPGFLYYDQLLLLTPLPSTSWDIDAVGGNPVSYTTLAGAEKIYKFLNAQAQKVSTYATNPLWQDVDGPFKLTAFNPSTHASTMVPNPNYSGPKASISKFREVAFTSDNAEYAALSSGHLTVGLVPSAYYPQIPTLREKGFNVAGSPDLGWDYLLFNFKDTTNNWDKVIGQLYVRQALAHLIDSAGYIKDIFHGYAAPADGPVPSVPPSPFTPANAASQVYPFSIASTESILARHGWRRVNNVQTCESATACGAGIPEGQRLAFTVVYNNGSPALTAEDRAFASDARRAGILVTLVGKSFGFILQNYYDLAAPANIDKWEAEDFGGFSSSLYPTTNTIFNTGGDVNIGDYSDRTADKLIESSVFGPNPSAVKAEATYIAADLPGLFQPAPDHVYAWSTKLSGPQASFWEMTQYSLNPELWAFHT
jgi:peptide/nickel transport system substrate-binding protein